MILVRLNNVTFKVHHYPWLLILHASSADVTTHRLVKKMYYQDGSVENFNSMLLKLDQSTTNRRFVPVRILASSQRNLVGVATMDGWLRLSLKYSQ